jgi:hypothetical protein
VIRFQKSAGFWKILREPLKTSVFSGFLTLRRKLHLYNSLYYESAFKTSRGLKQVQGIRNFPQGISGDSLV